MIEEPGEFAVPALPGAQAREVTLPICGSPYLTEIPAGWYSVDGRRRIVELGMPFANAMTVLATVVSANHSDRVTLEAGFRHFQPIARSAP